MTISSFRVGSHGRYHVGNDVSNFKYHIAISGDQITNNFTHEHKVLKYFEDRGVECHIQLGWDHSTGSKWGTNCIVVSLNDEREAIEFKLTLG